MEPHTFDSGKYQAYLAELSVCDGQSMRLQALSSSPAPEVRFKTDKSASKRFYRPPCVLMTGQGKGDTTLNPFAPADRAMCSTSYHVPSSLKSIPHNHSSRPRDQSSRPHNISSRNYHAPMESILHDQRSRPRAIPLHHLKVFTDNFSDERILGKGGSGVVYKGVLQSGDIIAVKKIVSSLMPGLQKQFENEVYHLMMVKHPNIVRCVGYCYETRNACLEYNGKYVFAETAERLLCLEYMPNGSLDKYISDESSGLGWRTRYKLIEGLLCYGLRHLHGQTDKPPIIHMDLKPANILLDDYMVPKITDFGLSRLLDERQTICTSSCDGTFGYMAPEYLHGGTITPKSDIFSLGVIIMEVVTGHRDYPDITGTSTDGFIELMLEKWRSVLPRWCKSSLETYCEQIKRCLHVGLICVNPDRTKRPLITKVISMLQGS